MSFAMRIEILNTGTELLLGNTVNTHAAWFGRELFKLGLRIERQTAAEAVDPFGLAAQLQPSAGLARRPVGPGRDHLAVAGAGRERFA